MTAAPAFRLVRPDEVDVEIRPKPPGTDAAARCTLVLRYLAVSDRRALLDRLREGGVTDAEVAHDLIVGWRGIGDESGAPIPFTAENLAAALDLPYFLAAVREALVDELFGRSAAGNSATPAGDGPPANGA